MMNLSRQPKVYIALEEYRFDWSRHEVNKFIRYWNDGMVLKELLRRFGRNRIEIAVLVMDLAERGEIKPRDNGLLGG